MSNSKLLLPCIYNHNKISSKATKIQPSQVALLLAMALGSQSFQLARVDSSNQVLRFTSLYRKSIPKIQSNPSYARPHPRLYKPTPSPSCHLQTQLHTFSLTPTEEKAPATMAVSSKLFPAAVLLLLLLLATGNWLFVCPDGLATSNLT